MPQGDLLTQAPAVGLPARSGIPVSDIVRLECGPGASRIQVLAGAMAQPAMAAFDTATRAAWIVLAPANAGPHELRGKGVLDE